MRVPTECCGEERRWLMIDVTWCFKFCFCFTRLNESNVENLIHLTVVSGDVEHAFRWILDTGDVDGNQIFGDLLPFHLTSATCCDMKHFRPQPEYTNDVKTQKQRQEPKRTGKEKNCEEKQKEDKKNILLCFFVNVCTDTGNSKIKQWCCGFLLRKIMDNYLGVYEGN